MTLVTGLYQRWRHLVHELAKFGIVGAINTVLDFSLANVLHLGLHWHALAAKTTSVAVAATSSYFMNRHWTFRHRARTGLRREYSLFFLLNGVALLMGLMVIGTTRYGLGLTDKFSINMANLVGIGIGTVFRFWSYKRWVFPAHREALADERAAA